MILKYFLLLIANLTFSGLFSGIFITSKVNIQFYSLIKLKSSKSYIYTNKKNKKDSNGSVKLTSFVLGLAAGKNLGPDFSLTKQDEELKECMDYENKIFKSRQHKSVLKNPRLLVEDSDEYQESLTEIREVESLNESECSLHHIKSFKFSDLYKDENIELVKQLSNECKSEIIENLLSKISLSFVASEILFIKLEKRTNDLKNSILLRPYFKKQINKLKNSSNKLFNEEKTDIKLLEDCSKIIGIINAEILPSNRNSVPLRCTIESYRKVTAHLSKAKIKLKLYGIYHSRRSEFRKEMCRICYFYLGSKFKPRSAKYSCLFCHQLNTYKNSALSKCSKYSTYIGSLNDIKNQCEQHLYNSLVIQSSPL